MRIYRNEFIAWLEKQDSDDLYRRFMISQKELYTDWLYNEFTDFLRGKE